eukprot:COSAG01_NODE_2012_length_8655_cov_3.344086_2_plen_58_part_00
MVGVQSESVCDARCPLHEQLPCCTAVVCRPWLVLAGDGRVCCCRRRDPSSIISAADD